MSKTRVIIVAMYRTGSTALVKGLNNVFKIRHLPEPWNYNLHPESKFADAKNVIGHGLVKTLIWQLPPGESDMIRFYSDFVKHYDNVIILGRKNRKELAESWHRAALTGNWYWSYYLEENHSLEIDLPKHNYCCDKLEELSEKLQIPITWYEDLYSGNLDLIQKCIDQWGLNITAEQLFKYVDPKLKYRLKKPKSTI